MMSSAEQHRQRVTVISPFGQHQVDLPLNVPVSRFLPDLLTAAGLHPGQDQAGSGEWKLEDATGRTLPADATLAAHGVLPGDVIQLRGVQLAGSGGGPDDAPAGRLAGRRSSIANGTDKVLLSRRVGRPQAPSGPPEDGFTPLQRAEAVLPRPVGQASRLIAATAAYFQGPKALLAAELAKRPATDVSGANAAGPATEASRADDAAGPDQQPPSGFRPGHDQPGQPDLPDPRSNQPQLHPHQPTPGRHRLLPSDLTLPAPPTRLECARTRWRDLDHLGRLDTRISDPRLQHCATIAVVSPKGGVGKTTVTALLGTLFSMLRRDPTVAVDTNPDFGSLGRVLTPDQTWYVDDLARLVAEDDELSLTALDSHLGRAIHGLLVVPAPTDPLRMAALDEDAYRRIITRMKDFFSLILLDCGTGLQDPASAAAIAASDQVLLLTDAQPATASLVAQSADLLHQSGRPITVVVNRMPARGAQLDLDRLSRYVPAARGLVVIPDEVPAATRLAGGSFHWRDAPAGWQLALRQLAVVLVSDWKRLGLAQ
jgi:MinD-like ATPase involved in chromosome partitioning or flagellar assembly